MAFYEEISQLTTLDTTHCDNFNNINQKLLENTLYCYTNIGNLYNLQTSNKSSLVEAINEVKRNSSSSTDINSGVDGKISVHNQSSDSHPLFQQRINNLMSYVGIPYAKKMDYPNYNNLTETGVYYTTDGTNAPGGGSWYLEVMCVNDRIVFQRAKCVSGDLLEQTKDRVYDTSTNSWTSWKLNSTSKDVETLNTRIDDIESLISGGTTNPNVQTFCLYNQVPSVSTKWTSIESFVNSLPDNSIFNGDYQTNFDSDANFPTSTGVVTAYKVNINRCYILYHSSHDYGDKTQVYFTFYRNLSNPKFFWKKVMTDYDTKITLQSLKIEDSSFSTTDFDANLIKIVEKVGYQNSAFFYFYETPYPRLNESFKTKLGLNVDGYALFVQTTSNNACVNTVHIYPNNTPKCYVFSYDNEIRNFGEVCFGDTYVVTEYQNGWTYATWGEQHRLRLTKSGNIVTLHGTLMSGSVSDETIICTLPKHLRPKWTVSWLVYKFDSPVDSIGTCTLYTNGEIKYRKGNVSTKEHICFNASFNLW